MSTKQQQITVWVEGEPRGKGRPRFGRTYSGTPCTYTDGRTRAEEERIRLLSMASRPPVPLVGPLYLVVVARMPVPQSFSATRRAQALQGRLHPTGRPDVDNVAKLVLDALNGLYWRDDAQIVEMAASKAYGLTPGLQITVGVRSEDALD